MSRLYADTQHTLTQDVVPGLTFEEVIGTLLQARDLHEQMQEMMEEEEVEVAPHVSAGLSQF
ncbi:MAG: hypothetical protein BWY76_01176 [bacterium ADurb.Bin429]|nr:MAG: hypothetical protein BWY76_01176 [bacterium ADurb.Bin429]